LHSRFLAFSSRPSRRLTYSHTIASAIVATDFSLQTSFDEDDPTYKNPDFFLQEYLNSKDANVKRTIEALLGMDDRLVAQRTPEYLLSQVISTCMTETGGTDSQG